MISQQFASGSVEINEEWSESRRIGPGSAISRLAAFSLSQR
jgi:hypothetical protein